MNKINEFSIVVQLQATEAQNSPCSCCGKVAALNTMNCSTLPYEDGWLITWACPNCLANSTEGLGIESGVPITMDKIEEDLLSAEEWLDTEIHNHLQGQPFIRRPTFAEEKRAALAGRVIPEGAAVVVMKSGDNSLRRRLLPMLFPWKADSEWMAGPGAAREALAVADTIQFSESTLVLGVRCV